MSFKKIVSSLRVKQIKEFGEKILKKRNSIPLSSKHMKASDFLMANEINFFLAQ